MKIAAVSDTHGNISGLKALYQFLVEEEGIKKFFHLGHYFHDVERAHLLQILNGENDESTFFSDLASALVEKENSIKGRIRKIIQVPAADDPEGKKGLVSNVEYAVLNGFITVAIHDIRNLTKEDIQNGYIFLHGATHIPQIEVLSGRVFINPGHFSFLENSRPTYALVSVTEESISVEIRDISHNVIKEKAIKVKRARKFGAR